MPGTNLCYCHVVPNTGNSESKSIPIQTSSRLLLYYNLPLCLQAHSPCILVQAVTCDSLTILLYQPSIHRSSVDNGIKTRGFRFCSLLNHSVMSALSTTNYLPLDLDALSAFSTTLIINHVCGELHLSYINTVWLWHTQWHSLYGEAEWATSFTSWLMSAR
jgi:hypothetical protein